MSIGDVHSDAKGSGARYNDGKTAFELIPGVALEDCAKVFEYGKRKYAAWNWAKGMPWLTVFGCLLRHLYAWARGEDNDPESGLPHLGHAMCNLVMLTTFARTFPEGDDRPKQWFGARKTAPETLAQAQSGEIVPHSIAAAIMHADAATDSDVAAIAAPGTPPTVPVGD